MKSFADRAVGSRRLILFAIPEIHAEEKTMNQLHTHEPGVSE